VNPYQNLQFQNPGNAFLQAYEGGRERRRESETQNALAKYAQNPDDPEALQGVIRNNPQLGMQLQERRQQQAMRGLEAHREKIVMGAKIVRQIQPKDDAGWQQVLQMAQQVGIDLADVPQQFDPQYVQGLISVADALDPQSGDQGFTLGPGQARYGPGGQLVAKGPPRPPRYYPVQPGGKLVLDPSYGGEEGDDEWEYVLPQGGPTPQASGGFPPAGY
jgi:hypothetical protein